MLSVFFVHQLTGHFCDIESIPDEQYSSSCQSGFFCFRGTSKILKEKNKCGLNYFCPPGTSSSGTGINHCPFQTKSETKSSHVTNCMIKEVDVCDKFGFDPRDPMADISYYPEHSYESLSNENQVIMFASSGAQNPIGEMVVVQKIIPIDYSTDTPMWKNDTVEVFRTCPSYEFNDSVESIIVIGRNFQNSTNLTCRFTACLGSNWAMFDHDFPHVPGKCLYANGSITNDVVEQPVEKKGQFISETRVRCPLPRTYSSDDVFANEITSKCKIDENGSKYYLQKCNQKELASGSCNEAYDVRENGHKRFRSLSIPCAPEEIDAKICDNVPELGMKLNPCISDQIIVEVSNNGAKFSGDKTIVPHTVGLDRDLFRNHKDFEFSSSYAIFTHIHNNTNQNSNSFFVQTESRKEMELIAHTDRLTCEKTIYTEEHRRVREIGWFELQFLSKAHLQFDWRHIPLNMKYDEHFKLAIYVKPSRCNDSKCNEKRSRQSDEERVPCMQPMDLPEWFLSPDVSKHQLLNLTMFSLDDAIFKVEVHILHGLFMSSSNFFLNTMAVEISSPSRAKTSIEYDRSVRTQHEKRMTSPFISWEERDASLEYFFGIRYTAEDSRKISPPLNMPPRWSNYAHGRVLLSMNTTYENPTPTIKEPLSKLRISDDFWVNPFVTPELAKEKTDTFFETFHGVKLQPNGKYGYDLEQLMLPYLPFFSNCREFDSYIPLWGLIESSHCVLPINSADFGPNWWRRDFPPLPHMDDIKAVGPFDFKQFYPVADWCERKVFCDYEEKLDQPDITPRWFEASTGASLFSIIRDPVNYYHYTGRHQTRTGLDDEGGQRFISSLKSSDTLIPLKIDRSAADDIEDGCDILCFPREMTLDISYYQVDKNSKRIVSCTLSFNNFDKNSSNTEYEMDVKFRPLDYKQLIVQFAYSRGIFVLLFVVVGIGTSMMAFLYWMVVRLTTQVESPPSIRFIGMLWLIFPQALGGFLVGLIPIVLVSSSVLILLKGFLIFTPEIDPEGLDWPVFRSYALHYKDAKIDPEKLNIARQGRMGLAFVIIAMMCIIEGSKIFIPDRTSSIEKELEKARDKNAEKESTWVPIRWRRSNLVYTSFMMGLFLVVIVEWSFWGGFGTYIWEAIIALKVMNILASHVVDNQLKESLLSAPVMTSMGLIQGLVTLSAVDFMDFLLSYIVEFGFLILERMYTDPYQSTILSWIQEKISRCFIYGKKMMQKRAQLEKTSADQADEANQPEERLVDAGGETVEPIIDSYGSYCCDTLSLLYTPFIIVLLMVFRDETGIPTIYGIKEQDMEYYLLFALVIIPFQITADIFIHASQELFHGWKIYDYLVYTRYRFLQRETRWKGLEDSLDECIDESMRTLDQMCFSSQFYLMLVIHVNGIVYLVLGIEMMVRAKYNLFGDPVMPLLLPFVVICSLVTKKVLIWAGIMFNIWKIKHENTAWHIAMRTNDEGQFDDLDEIQGASHDAYFMNQRLTSETFRYKFLNYNRSWLIEQLPTILTPRTLRRSRPYLVNQFTKVLNTLNDDISSDSDVDATPEYGIPSLNVSSRKLLRWWLNQAQRRKRLKEVVQPMIQSARGSHCEQCLSLKQLKVETIFSLEEM